MKVLNKSGFGWQDWLVKDLRWARENAARYNINVVNLSAGIYGNKWGLLPCNGDFPVCTEARALHDSGVILVVAAGNDGPDQLPCPQRVGILEGKFWWLELSIRSHWSRLNIVARGVLGLQRYG